MIKFSENAFWRYPAAFVSVAVFVGLGFLLHPLLGDNAPLMLFILPIILAALFGDFFTGVLATLVSAAAGTYFFIQPHYSIAIENQNDFFFVVTFVVVGIIVSWLVEQLHRARRFAETKTVEAEHETVESRIAEEHAREMEARFYNVANAAPVMMWIADTTRKCIWFNNLWLDFTGRAIEQEINSERENEIHPDDLQSLNEVYFTAFDRREPFSAEYRLRRADGEFRWLLDHGVPRFAPHGDFLGYIGSCIDIHDRKQVMHEIERSLEETQQAKAQAEIANRLKDEFIGTVSHELRTPLNAILGWVQMLREGIVTESQQTKAIEVIERNARSQAQLIEDLLDVTRITSGKFRLNIKPIPPASIVEAAIDTMRPTAQTKNVEFVTEIDQNAGTIMGDADRLQQIVWNLLSNAVKFSDQNGKIEVRLANVDSHVEITVRDYGKGIEPEFLPYVFDRFRQQDGKTTRKYGGLGLGLAIVRHIAELHGGTVRAESDGEGMGATFAVELPLHVESEITQSSLGQVNKPIPAVEFNEMPQLSVDLHGLKIIIVDDEPDARELLTSLLTIYGADVTMCASAAEVLNVLPTIRPNILISDVGMPVMDGYAMIKKVREFSIESGGQTPAIALTAFTRVEDRVRALTQGFQMFVPKPVEPSELVAAIKSLTGLNEEKNADS